MEAFTTPPYREKRPPGRPATLSLECRLMVGAKVTSKEMTYEEAAKTFGLSQGSVGSCVKLFKSQSINQRRNERNQERNEEIKNYQQQAQVKALKQQIADLFIENQMLKKILQRSLQIKKDNGSVITTENLGALQEDAE